MDVHVVDLCTVNSCVVVLYAEVLHVKVLAAVICITDAQRILVGTRVVNVVKTLLYTAQQV